MSAEKIAPTAPPKSSLPEANWVAAQPRPSLGIGLRQIMLLLIYCAIASLIARPIYETRSGLHIALLGIWLGSGICYLGLWLAFRLGELAVVGWVTFMIGYIIATAAMMGWLAIPVIPLVIGVIVYLHIQHRWSQQNGLLWVMAVAADRQIPLAPGVEAYSSQTIGVFGERAHALATLLHRGHSLTDAIDRVPRVVGWDAAVLIQVGEQIGQLACGLRAATDARAGRQRVFRDLLGRIAYLYLVLNIAQSIIGFTAYFIVPKFEAIFKDFDTELPDVTRGFLISTYYFSEYAPWCVLAELVLTIYVIGSVAARGWQGLPIVGRLFRLQHKALILKSLALAVDAGQPVDRVFEILRVNYPSERVRRKLHVAADLSRSGVSWIAALDGVGLISLRDVGVLEAATRAGNLAWALRTLAETGERRIAYRIQMGSHVAFLVALLLFGLLVLGVCVALFAPLIHLIERLAG